MLIQTKAAADVEPQKLVFENGITFLARPIADTRALVLGIWVKTGSRDESPRWNGMCHFIEHMVFKGTTTRTAYDIALALESVGGSLEAYTTKEYTCFYARVLAEFADRAVDVLTDLVLRPTFLAENLALERNVVLEEIANVFDTPDDWIHDLFAERMYSEHSLARPILGTRETVSKFDSSTVSEFYGERYVGGNIIVSAAGVFDSDRIAEDIEPRLSFAAKSIDRGEERGPRANIGEHWIKKDLGQEYLCLGAPGVSYRDGDRYAVILLSVLLGGGMSSRLFQKIREQAGLAYAVYSYADFYRDAGHLATYMAVKPEKTAEALDRTLSEFESITKGSVTQEELDNVRAQVKGRILLGMEGTTSKMSRMAKNEIYYGRHIPIEEILNTLESVSLDDIQRMAQFLLDPKRLVLTGLGPAELQGVL